ncbi:MAG: PIN domain-containing protein [Acidobacteriota bacterium]
MKLFIDTWGWLELRDKRGSRHQEVNQHYVDFQQRGGIAYTSDYVLDETITHFFNRLHFKAAEESVEAIRQAISAGFLRLEWITETRFEQALKLRRKFDDKPRISFTDLTSMVVMAEFGITDVLTEDGHFVQVGLGFNKVP